MVTIEESSSPAKALNFPNVQSETWEFVLKREQETAVKELLCENNVMAILPTGFGKSLIFTVFALAREEMLSAKTCFLIIEIYVQRWRGFTVV